MNRIKLLREEFKISQEELAKKLDLSKGIISLYENESRKPSLEVLVKLSEIFNCSIDYILGKSDIRNPEKIEIDTDKIQIGLSANDYTEITDEQYENRMILRNAMIKNGFKPLDEEWWHFTLENEPYPDTYFKFPVSSDSVGE